MTLYDKDKKTIIQDEFTKHKILPSDWEEYNLISTYVINEGYKREFYFKLMGENTYYLVKNVEVFSDNQQAAKFVFDVAGGHNAARAK